MDTSKHPILKKYYGLCRAIENCGASEELTEASSQANDLARDLEYLVDIFLNLKQAALNVLDLAEQTDDGFEFHPDLYTDLVDAHEAVYLSQEQSTE